MMVGRPDQIAPDHLGADQITEWLDWWAFECDFGAKPKQAGVVGQEMREIRTLEDLLWIIEARMSAIDWTPGHGCGPRWMPTGRWPAWSATSWAATG